VVEVPTGTGAVTGVEWNFDGATWSYQHAGIDGSQSRVAVTTAHTFDAPGTYLPTVLAHAHRDGRSDDPHHRVSNLARTRVVVSD
jgi:hypothetical protein